MAMYALPTLSVWQNAAGGWSNTSGGPDNGTYPQGGDTVIFDANSGPARTINIGGGSIYVSISGLTMNTCNQMSIAIPSGSVLGIQGYSGTLDMLNVPLVSGAGRIVCGNYQNAGSVLNFRPPQGIACPMSMGMTTYLQGPLITNNTLSISGTSDVTTTLYTQGWPVTAGTLTDNGYVAYYLSGGSWTATGTFGQSSGSIFNPGNNFFYQGGTLIVDAKAGLGQLTINPSGGDLTGSVWFKSTPSGYGVAYYPVIPINNFRMDAGTRVAVSGTVNANSYTVSGAPGSRAAISNLNGSNTKSAMKLNAGAAQSRQYFNSTDLSSFDFSPTGIFYGRGCTTSNCTGFTNTSISMNNFNFL